MLDEVIPQGLRPLLAAQLERLTPAEQDVLEVGSVAGVEFVVASVAAGVPPPPEAIEVVCEGLARRGQLLEYRGLAVAADSTGVEPDCGQVAVAHQALTDALVAVRCTGEHWWEAELHRLQGEFLLRQATPGAAQAEACFQQALGIARRHQPGAPVAAPG